MRDQTGSLLYVGKAKNVRKRLISYRVANPDRMRRRQLRLLHLVTHIEIESCTDEPQALAREAELLLGLKPKFNRAGTWPAPPRFLVWRLESTHLALRIAETLEPGWNSAGPLGSVVRRLHAVLARLLWCAAWPGKGFQGMPVGWHHGHIPELVRIDFGNAACEAESALALLLDGDHAAFSQWFTEHQPADVGTFQRTALATDLECLTGCLRALHRSR
jgi:hypothetical protein